MKTTNNNSNANVNGNIYAMVTERIIEQLNNGIIPWRKPWNHATGSEPTINYVTRKPYSMLNCMLLGESGEYLTFKQIQQLNGKVKKGAKSRMVVFFKPQQITKQEEVMQPDGTKKIETKVFTIPFLQYYRVFHLSDTTGIESKLKKETKKPIESINAAENVITDYITRERLKFTNTQQSDRAYYNPMTDEVVVPCKEQYNNICEYYSTTFHELTHSTLKASRCNRESDNAIAAFGSQNYSREELVAEIGSAMLCTATGIDNTKAFTNSVAYIQSWLRALKNDVKMIVWASTRAEKASKYIQGIKE